MFFAFLFLLYFFWFIYYHLTKQTKKVAPQPQKAHDSSNLDKFNENIKAATEKLVKDNAEIQKRLNEMPKAPDITFVKKDINSFGDYVDFEEVL